MHTCLGRCKMLLHDTFLSVLVWAKAPNENNQSSISLHIKPDAESSMRAVLRGRARTD